VARFKSIGSEPIDPVVRERANSAISGTHRRAARRSITDRRWGNWSQINVPAVHNLGFFWPGRRDPAYSMPGSTISGMRAFKAG